MKIDTLQLSYNTVTEKFISKVGQKCAIKHLHSEHVQNINMKGIVEMKNAKIDSMEIKMDQLAYQYLIGYSPIHI